jgi:hypothetical protein
MCNGIVMAAQLEARLRVQVEVVAAGGGVGDRKERQACLGAAWVPPRCRPSRYIVRA